MSTHDKEEALKEHISRFVAETLNGRYKGYICDTLLTMWLFFGVRKIVHAPYQGEEHLEPAFERRENIAYDAGCPIFESALEHACRAGGNGHHVAQSFAAHMKEFSLGGQKA
jgi:hypothetical protein